VAVLHDVVEDAPEWTLGRLSTEGFSPRVIDAVASMTRRPGEEYADFILRSKANPIGKVIKYADLQDNSDLRRIPNPTEDDRERKERYSKAMYSLSKT
jgi:hypothetical protein